jgi:hypothetical protein
MPGLPDETGTIGLIVERRHLETRALVDLRSTLVAAGWRLDVVVPDAASVYGIPPTRRRGTWRCRGAGTWQGSASWRRPPPPASRR